MFPVELEVRNEEDKKDEKQENSGNGSGRVIDEGNEMEEKG